MSQHEADATRGGGDGEIARVPSLVPGLDAVLRGGFLQGGVYMVQGPPGAGKTVLGTRSSTAGRPPKGTTHSSSPCSARTTVACWRTCARCAFSTQPSFPTA
jgi:hypothetical protein